MEFGKGCRHPKRGYFFLKKEYLEAMSDTYTIKTAQQKFSAVITECEDHPVTITKQGKAVAVLVSMDRMEAIAETMELLADPKAMEAIRKHREGQAVYHDLAALDSL